MCRASASKTGWSPIRVSSPLSPVRVLRIDNGPELISSTLDAWAAQQSVKLDVAMDATYVYWTVRGTAGATGSVMRAGR